LAVSEHSRRNVKGVNSQEFVIRKGSARARKGQSSKQLKNSVSFAKQQFQQINNCYTVGSFAQGSN